MKTSARGAHGRGPIGKFDPPWGPNLEKVLNFENFELKTLTVSTSPENWTALSFTVPEIFKGEYVLQKWRKLELKTFPTCEKVKISSFPGPLSNFEI